MATDRLLSLSQAARLVGVRRKTLQQLIQESKLQVFEGAIRESELLKEFPEARFEQSGMVERMHRIREGALFKCPRENRPSAEQLAGELHRLRLQLVETRLELESYQQLTAEFQERLYDLQEHCDHRQAAMLGTVITWLGGQLSRHR